MTLTPAGEPGNSGGTYRDNTIDFGLLGLRPTLYVAATFDDSIQAFDTTTGLYQGDLISHFGVSHSQGDGEWGDLPYNIELGPDGKWYASHFGASNIRRISATGADEGAMLDNSAAGVSWISCFAFGPDGNYYVVDSNGQRVVRFQGPGGPTPGAPMGAAPYTFISQAGITDLNFGPDGNIYLVIESGTTREIRRHSASTGVLLGTVVTEFELMNMVTGGQSLAIISGIDIHGSTLYGVNRADGEVFSIDLTNPATPGDPQLLATISSAGKGSVVTADIEYNPSDGHLYAAGYSWGKPLVGGTTYTSGALVKIDPTPAPAGVVSIFEVPMPSPPGPNNQIWPGPRDVGLGKTFAPLPESVAIGSHVWNDEDGDGRLDNGETGIPGVRVELWRDANSNVADGAEARVGWTFTNSQGLYYFSGQAPGIYQIRIPDTNFGLGQALANNGFSSPPTRITDNNEDGDDNGIQLGGNKTEVVSPLITLTPGDEPLGNGVSAVERDAGGELDDYVVDANGNMTVDFGFVEPGDMGIGNLVFNDLNGDGRPGAGEGVNEATVELYFWGAVPGTDQPLAITTTDEYGKYLFEGLWTVDYFVHLPAAQFTNGGGLRGLFSLPGTSPGDDDAGENGIDTTEPWNTGISSDRITLTANSAPVDNTASNPTGIETGTDYEEDSALGDENIDLTVDFGLYRPVSLGNLVFRDKDNSNSYTDGEGVGGVTVDLYYSTQTPGTDPAYRSTQTDGAGIYTFNDLLAGTYVVHIPSKMFAEGEPLHRTVSIQEGLVGDDDVGEDGINGGDPAFYGVSSLPVAIFAGSAPTAITGESGVNADADDQNDAAIDLTIDFGFQTPVGLGNLVFIDEDSDGRFDSSIDTPKAGVTVDLYSESQTPGLAVPLHTQVTDDGGRYFFGNLAPGGYVVHISAEQFQRGRPLHRYISTPDPVTPPTEMLDDDSAGSDNGIDTTDLLIYGIQSPVIQLQADDEPVSADFGGIESGIDADIDVFDDNNFDLTVDFGFVSAVQNGVGIGNLVYKDMDGDGKFDLGEGVDDVVVELYYGAETPGPGIYPLASTTTTGGGLYRFSNLDAGGYLVHLPPQNFAAGAPLEGWKSLPGHGGDNRVDDNIAASNDNGVDSDTLADSGISTAAITLQVDSEPMNAGLETGYRANIDDVDDNNTDLTVDFGFLQPVSVGNVVFIDEDYNGFYNVDGDTPGLGKKVTLEIFRSDMDPLHDLPLSTTDTGSFGAYRFDNLAPGTYFIRIPPSNFAFGEALYQTSSVYGVQAGQDPFMLDDNTGEDGIDVGNPTVTGVRSADFTLAGGAAPTGEMELGLDGEMDNDTDDSVDLTLDFGFVRQVRVGNLIFADDDNDGIMDAGTELGISGVTVQLWSNETANGVMLASTVTNSFGFYSFQVAPGSYHIRVPGSQFEQGSALYGKQPSSPDGVPVPQSTAGDDDVAQDGYAMQNNLTASYVRTPDFVAVRGGSPRATTGETGYLSENDDSDDANGDLTVDLGFSPVPLTVGNLVYRDLNGNGTFQSGLDSVLPGVEVRLHRVGDDPYDPETLPVDSMMTGTDGTYRLRTYEAGSFFIFLPATNFVAGGPLAGMSSIQGNGEDDEIDDNADENGFDTDYADELGMYSATFYLDHGLEPAGAAEGGYLATQDDAADTNGDMTFDFGFTGGSVSQLMSIGNLVYNDANLNGVADAGEGVPNVWMILRVPSATDPSGWAMTQNTYTDAEGRYAFSNLVPGNYKVHVAADNFKVMNGTPGSLYRKMSLRGNHTARIDDNFGEDGVDVQNPHQVGIDSGVIELLDGQAPTGATEGGLFGSSDNVSGDNMADLTVDFGFATRIGIGNLAFKDLNADGAFNPAPNGIDQSLSGISIELVHRDTASGTDTVLANTQTDVDGHYLFYAPPATGIHRYFVRVPKEMFSATGMLRDFIPAINSTGVDDFDNQDAQPTANPATTGVSSPIVAFEPNVQPTANTGENGDSAASDDGEDDANINLTVDFGFKPKTFFVGNIVFLDENDNSKYDNGDVGVGGVTVRLYNAGDPTSAPPVAETVTAVAGGTATPGSYYFQVSNAGSYYLYIPKEEFASGGDLHNRVSSAGHGATQNGGVYDVIQNLDDRYDENGLDLGTPLLDGVRSGNIQLAHGTLPLNSSVTDPTGENGIDSFKDDVYDASGTLTVDFGFRPPPAVPLVISTTVLPNGARFTSYNAQFLATGGTTPYSWNLVGSGTPPPGVNLSSSGLLSGTPLESGSFSFVVCVHDSAGNVAESAFTINVIAPTLTIMPSDAPVFTTGTTQSFIFQVPGGAGGFTWDIVSGQVPGMFMNSYGNFYGTPTQTGVFSIIVRVVNSSGAYGLRAYSIHVIHPYLAITPTVLPLGSILSTYSAQFATSGGTAPYIWSVQNSSGGSSLPPGLTLSTTGQIFGTPLVAGTFQFAVQVNDSTGRLGRVNTKIEVKAPTFQVYPAVLPTGTQGSTYTAQFTAGGNGPFTWSALPVTGSNSLPQGLQLSPTTGQLSGVPVVSGLHSFFIRAVSSDGQYGFTRYELNLMPAVLKISPVNLPNYIPGEQYQQQLSVTGGNGSVAWELVSGTPPQGIQLDATTGALIGTSSLLGTHTFVLRATSGALSATRTCYLTAQPSALVITSTPTILPSTTSGATYSVSFEGAGGSVPLSWQIVSGMQPPGLQLTSGGTSTAILSGTISPGATAGTYEFALRATDTASKSSTRYFSITIDPPQLYVSPSVLPTAVIGDAYTAQLTGTGGSGSYSWMIIGGSLPPGMTLNSATGLIQGSAAVTGTYPIVLRMQDATGASRLMNYSFVVSGPLISISLPTTQSYVGTAFNAQFIAGGGTAPYSWQLVSGTLPYTFDTTTGSLSGTTNTTGIFRVVLRATDSKGAFGLATYTLNVGTPGAPAGGNTQRNVLSPVTSVQDGDSTVSTATTFAAWAAENVLHSPLDDPDADSRTNLLEYALSTPPQHGRHAAHFLLCQNPSTGGVDAHLIRAQTTLKDIRYTLQISSDAQAWSTLSLVPLNVQNTDGTTTAVYRDIDSRLATGHIRLHIALDADLNGTPEAVTTSAVHAWTRQEMTVGRQTLSMPLLRSAFFIGRVKSVTQNVLELENGPLDILQAISAHPAALLEVQDGSLSGHIFDIDLSTSTAETLALRQTPPAALSGARIAIRPHWTLGTLLPGHHFLSGTSSSTADRVLFYDSAAKTFRIHWLHSEGGSLKWVREGDASLSSAADRVIAPQEGMLLQLREQPAVLTLIGELCPLPRPVPATGSNAVFRGITTLTARTPASLPASAGCKLRLWSGDTQPGSSNYLNYQLSPESIWIEELTSRDVTHEPLLQPFRAYFLTP
ncbi:MAG: putative Ig domain-containing protein [Verrucomicrobiaceae bacterium]|nr:putative Ig domain-containing protein [Verrucomicrobiaceae bacterium]